MTSNDPTHPENGQNPVHALIDTLEVRRGTIADRLSHQATRLSEYIAAAREAEGQPMSQATFTTPFESLSLSALAAAHEMSRDAGAMRELNNLLVLLHAEAQVTS